MKRLFALCILFWSLPAFASTQFPDRIVVEKDAERDLLPYEFLKTPLMQAFEKDPELFRRAQGVLPVFAPGNCTAMYRGYVAHWKLEAGKLYLVRLEGTQCKEGRDIPLSVLSPDVAGPVAATWFTGELTVGFPPAAGSGDHRQYSRYAIIGVENGTAKTMRIAEPR